MKPRLGIGHIKRLAGSSLEWSLWKHWLACAWTTLNDDLRNCSWRNFSTVVLASGNAFFRKWSGISRRWSQYNDNSLLLVLQGMHILSLSICSDRNEVDSPDQEHHQAQAWPVWQVCYERWVHEGEQISCFSFFPVGWAEICTNIVYNCEHLYNVLWCGGTLHMLEMISYLLWDCLLTWYCALSYMLTLLTEMLTYHSNHAYVPS